MELAQEDRCEGPIIPGDFYWIFNKRPKHELRELISMNGEHKLWHEERYFHEGTKTLNVIMLNPSVLALGKSHEPTMQVLRHFCKDNKFGRLIITNLFTYRTPHPEDLRKELYYPGLQAHHRACVQDAAEQSMVVCCAWGNHGKLKDRDREIIGLIEATGKDVFCFAQNKNGTPSHPLRLKPTLTLNKFVYS